MSPLHLASNGTHYDKPKCRSAGVQCTKRVEPKTIKYNTNTEASLVILIKGIQARKITNHFE